MDMIEDTRQATRRRSAKGFQLTSANALGDRTSTTVRLPHLVGVQVLELEAVLRRALDEIGEAEKLHRDRFKGQRLETILAGLAHPVEKMHEAVRDDTCRQIGMHAVERVQESMREFRGKLAERGEPFVEGLELNYQQLDSALSRLTDYFNGTEGDRELAGILASFAGDRVNELRDWARTVDEDYGPPSVEAVDAS